MLSIRKTTSSSSGIFVYIIAIVLGIFVSIFGVNRFLYNQTWTSEDISQQHRTFVIKDYVSQLHNRSFTASVQRNLVITAAVNADLVSTYRFSRSVRASCYSCTLVIIVTKAAMSDRNFQELADAYSIIFISDEEYFPAKLKAERPDTTIIYISRWIIIKHFLSSLQVKGTVFDNVFACDSLDSLFQQDVFAYMNNYTPGLFAFMEDVQMTIGTCRINRGWIKGCYGENELKKVFNKSISCSGTVLGTWSAMMSYLSVMESEIIATPATCKGTGIDQGIHNYIIYNNKVPHTTIHHISHEYGFVGTLGYAKWLNRNQFGLVLNANRSIYAVIHQWNRSKQMIAQFKREYQLVPPNVRDTKN